AARDCDRPRRADRGRLGQTAARDRRASHRPARAGHLTGRHHGRRRTRARGPQGARGVPGRDGGGAGPLARAGRGECLTSMPLEPAVPADPVACPGGSVVVFDPVMTASDFGPPHPMAPLRVALTMRLAEELGVTGPGGFLRQVPAPIASDDALATVHSPALLEAVM